MRLGSTSITVTGTETPSSVNTRVIPLFLPTKPIAIWTSFLFQIVKTVYQPFSPGFGERLVNGLLLFQRLPIGALSYARIRKLADKKNVGGFPRRL